MKPYPSLKDKSADGMAEMLQFISRQREIDTRDWNNLQNIYVLGRKVGKIPASSADVDATDRVGDVNYTTTYLYILVDNAGTAVWRRVALGSW